MRRRRRAGILIDIAPIVDTVFNLMIFFALSLNFLALPGLPVNLPTASSQVTTEAREQIAVTITAEDRVMFEGRTVTGAALKEQLRKRAAAARDTLLVVRADAKAHHGKVVEVMDLARTAGLHRLAIAARPPTASGDH